MHTDKNEARILERNLIAFIKLYNLMQKKNRL